MATTRNQLIALIRQVMDATDSDRWSDDFLLTVANGVYDDEWSNILNAAPYYTFAQRSLSTDVSGQVPFSSLDSGSGDSKQNFYRVLSVSDGNTLYTETRFQDVPLAVTSNYLPQYPRLYYIVGRTVQILPVGTGVGVYIAVNYKPVSLLAMSSGTVDIDFPDEQLLILANEAAARALESKAGAEAQGATILRNSASRMREDFLQDLARRTINPRRLAYSDTNSDWAGW